ncbi:MAG: type II secretion system F family protein [Candidatus Hydrogenedentes bacterium]|nr:type II secretion system F family protein [Candidatus Hydrogenedentota bacterium]
MATFAYEAIREPGQPVKGEIEAEDVHSAAAALLQRGYHVLTIEDADAASAHRRRPRLGLLGGLKHRELVRLTRDTANLLKAGLPLSQALVTLAGRSTNPGWRSVLGGIRARLEDGQTFSQSLSAYPEVYDAMYVNLVRAGEESGKLVEVLMRLAEVGEKREDIRARVKMAMVYPAVMLTLGAVTVFVMLSFVVPMFVGVFRETGQVLPLPTRILIGVSGFFKAWWWAILLGLPAPIYGLMQYAKSERGKHVLGAMILRLALLGELVRKTEVAGFSQTLGTLLGSGLPIVNALSITASTLKNPGYGDAVRAMGLAVRDGGLLSEALAKQALFPEMVSSIVSVGEQSGDLPGSLEQLAEENERDVDRHVKVVMTLLEPLMIIMLGLIVAFIVLAVLLPIFNIGDTIQV